MPIPDIAKKKHRNSAINTRHSSLKPTLKKRLDQKKKEEETKKGPGKKKKKLWKKLLWLVLILAVLGLGLGLIGIAAAYSWVSKDLADITDIETRTVQESTKIYDRTGEKLLYEVGDYRRTVVPVDRINKNIQLATISLEDRKFYTHSGVDFLGIARAIIRSHSVTNASATSTITQQFIKNAILNKDHTFKRKFKEAILSLRLEQKYSKDEIMAMYLNEVGYGGNVYGIEEAAKEYFHKSAADVSLAEAATLAAIPKAPTTMLTNPDRLQARKNYALDVMAEEGYITSDEAEQAKQENISINERIDNIDAPHFALYVKQYLEEKYGQTSVGLSGLKVITTLDWDKQQKAEEAVRNGITKVEQYGGSNAALVAIDPHTGQVWAMVGSRDFFDNEHGGQINMTARLLQPGSSIKPVAYLAAFDKGYTPETKVFDLVTNFPSLDGGPNYQPHNYSLGTAGPVTLRYALSHSLNIPAVKTLYLVGINNFLDLAEKLGYTSFKDRSRFGLAVVLGGAEVTPLEHTAAYATYAREGEYHKPVTVLRVEDRNGNVLEEWKDNTQQVIKQESVRTLNSVLSDSNSREGIFATLNLSDRPVAAKTGTTDDFRAAWTMGYTPSLAVGVWVGNNDFTPMKYGADGLVVATPIWKTYMESILAGTPVETFQTADYKAANSSLAGNLEKTKEVNVDVYSGEIIPDECLNTYPKEYVLKKEMKEAHSILYYVDKNNPTGPPPQDPNQDPMFSSWEGAVKGWTQSEQNQKEYLTEATPKVNCGVTGENQQPKLTLISPSAGVDYMEKNLILVASATPGTGRTITAVTFLIDNLVVDARTGLTIKTQQNIQSFYNPSSLTAGKHSVTVRITADRQHTDQDTTNN